MRTFAGRARSRPCARDRRQRRDRRAVLGPRFVSLRLSTCSAANPISRRASASSSRISASTFSISRGSCSATSSALTARTRRVNPAIRGEDVATILLDHESGVTSIVDCSYATRLAVEPFPETLVEVDGSEGSLRLDQGYELVGDEQAAASDRKDVSPPLLPWASRPWHNIQESVQAIQQHWVDCLREGREPATRGATTSRRSRSSRPPIASANCTSEQVTQLQNDARV